MESRFSQMAERDIQQLLNPLTDENLEDLRDVQAAGEVIEMMLAKAEMAGIPENNRRDELRAALQQAKALIAVYGDGR